MRQWRHGRTVGVLLLGLMLLVPAVWWGQQWRIRQEQARLEALGYEPPPEGMVLVPAGEFWMGSDDPDAEPDERPLRKIFVPAFYIDKYEVTNRRYKEFDKDYEYPEGEDDLPATFILKSDAEAFCRWAGRRLPTRAEWEKAARGTDGRRFPWGNEFKPDSANILSGDGRVDDNSVPVGSFPAGASPYGVEDMSGNVWEWVEDEWVDKDGFGFGTSTEKRGILKGGAHGYSCFQARASYQGFEALDATCHDVGFRCAMDAKPKSH